MGFEPLREVEGIAFLKNNSIAVPSGIFTLSVTGGKSQPTIEKNYLQHEGVGKPGTISDVLEVYLPNKYNVG
jgi:hypothetical protein